MIACSCFVWRRVMICIWLIHLKMKWQNYELYKKKKSCKNLKYLILFLSVRRNISLPFQPSNIPAHPAIFCSNFKHPAILGKYPVSSNIFLARCSFCKFLRLRSKNLLIFANTKQKFQILTKILVKGKISTWPF